MKNRRMTEHWTDTGQISVRIGRYVCLRFITARSTLPNYGTRVVRIRDKYIAVNKLLISILAWIVFPLPMSRGRMGNSKNIRPTSIRTRAYTTDVP